MDIETSQEDFNDRETGFKISDNLSYKPNSNIKEERVTTE
jgi:hypothetical protein